MASSNGVEAKSMESNTKTSQGFFVAQVMLRCLAAMLALAGVLVMLKSGQSTTVFGIEFQARYRYSSAFRFLLGVDIAICVFCVISLISICTFYGPKSNTKSYFSLFLHDLIAVVLLMSGCAAATAIGYVGRYGQDQTGWTKICDNVHKFCDFVMVSIALSYLSFICLFILTVMAFTRATSCANSI
uniref:CASP-like protein n=1 Tax=Opuntia streptacantha TaxID=393608 RepID=A0A7C9DM27_OPUST